jgi:hypothetical protein
MPNPGRLARRQRLSLPFIDNVAAQLQPTLHPSLVSLIFYKFICESFSNTDTLHL